MSDSNQIDATMLVLKMVGGSLDGKLLPISTQKCFLTGGEQNHQDQCAIIRGPSGTAIKSTESILVNDHADTLHWLSEGDTIRIGQTTMVVEQLGNFGESTVSTTELDDSAVATQVETQSTVEDSEFEASIEAEPADESSREPNATESANEALEQLAEATESQLQEDSDADQSDAESELRAFLNNAETQPVQEDQSTSVEQNTPRNEEPSIEPNLSNELLERALNSLKNPSDHPIEEVPAETPSNDEPTDQAELSTEQNVDQQLDNIQNQIESQIQSYDSLSEPNETEDESPIVDLTPSNQENELSETTAETNDASAASSQQSIEEIMNRLRNSGTAPAQEAPQAYEATADENDQHEPVEHVEPEMPVANELDIEEPQAETPSQEPEFTSEPIEPAPGGNSIQDVMSLLTNAGTESPAENEIEQIEPPQAIEPQLNEVPAPMFDNTEVPVEDPQASEEPSAAPTPAAATTPAAPEFDENDTSVAAVLARMQSAGKLADYNMPEDNNEPAMPAGQSVTEPIRQPAEPEAAPAEDAHEGGDVQDYMNQLFQRLRGSNAPESAVPAPQPKPVEEAKPEPTAEEPVETVKPVERVLTANEYVPQQQAPEEKSHLEAMRQLANQQKESAVQISTSKRSQVQQMINQCVAVACFVIAVFLGRMATSLTDPLALVSFGCGVASLMGFFRFLWGLRNGKNDEMDDAEAEAAKQIAEMAAAAEEGQ